MVIEKAQQVIANLQQEVAQLRSENRHLRRKVGPRHPFHYTTAPRILRRSYDDALALLTLAFNDFPTSRQFFYELGYSERRYYWAIGMLRAARVMAAKGRRLLVDDFQTAENKLQTKYETLKAQVDALEVLRIYMPKKMGHVYTSRRDATS